MSYDELRERAVRWYDGRIPVTPSQLRRRADGRHDDPPVFVLAWFGGMLAPENAGGLKVVVAALLTFVLQGVDAYALPWKGLLGAWLLDMLFGLVATARVPERRFRWSKFGDGFLKLLVILAVPPVIAALEAGWGSDGWVTAAVIALFGADLLLSALISASLWWPGLMRVHAVIVRIREKGEAAVTEGVVVVDERPSEGRQGGESEDFR